MPDAVPQNAYLLEQLRPALDVLDADANWQLTPSGHQARKCDIFKVTSAERTLALKVYKSGVASENAAQIQYDALKRCNHAAANQPILRAPKALAFLPEDRAILMDWQHAPTLRTALWKRFSAPQQRRALLTAAGSWLRAFHGLSDIASQPLDGSKLCAKLDTQMSRNPSAVVTLNNNTAFQAALQRFQELASNTISHTPHALLHGDFTPTNLLVDDAGIIGMDMWGARLAPVYEDIARMLAYLGVVSPFAMAAAPLNPQSKLAHAFTQGYGEDLLDHTSASFQTILLYQQLRRWLVYAGRKANRPKSPLARWQLAKNQRLIGQTLTWLEDCKT